MQYNIKKYKNLLIQLNQLIKQENINSQEIIKENNMCQNNLSVTELTFYNQIEISND